MCKFLPLHNKLAPVQLAQQHLQTASAITRHCFLHQADCLQAAAMPAKWKDVAICWPALMKSKYPFLLLLVEGQALTLLNIQHFHLLKSQITQQLQRKSPASESLSTLIWPTVKGSACHISEQACSLHPDQARLCTLHPVAARHLYMVAIQFDLLCFWLNQ